MFPKSTLLAGALCALLCSGAARADSILDWSQGSGSSGPQPICLYDTTGAQVCTGATVNPTAHTYAAPVVNLATGVTGVLPVANESGAGSNQQLQVNCGGALCGYSFLSYNPANSTLTLPDGSTISGAGGLTLASIGGTNAAVLSLTPGAAPATPSNGQLWDASGVLQAELSGVTQQLATLGQVQTFTAKQIFAPTTAAGAGVNVGQGTGPTSPVNGDIWITTSGAFARVNGATAALGVTVPTAAAAGSTTQIQYNCSSVLCGLPNVTTDGTNLFVAALGLPGITGSTQCLQVNSSGTVSGTGGACTSGTPPGGSSGQLQFNNTTFGGATGYVYTGGATDTLTGPDGTAWKTTGIKLGSSSKLDINSTWEFSASTPLIAAPSCGGGVGGAVWMVGGDAAFCSHATTGATDDLAFGTIIFQSLTTGCCNTMMGSENFKNGTTGSNNTGIGFEADHLITTGGANTGIGNVALSNLTTGSNNVAIGNTAGDGLSGGASGNVCVYATCGAANADTGSNNVVVGGGGPSLTTGSRNIFMGPTSNGAGFGIATGHGNVYLGGQTTLSDQSDSITLADGDSNVLLQYLSANGYAEVSYPVKIDGKFLRMATTTVSGLTTADPSPSVGDRAVVTDATSCAFNSGVTGGGSTKCPVVYLGSWVGG